MVRADGGAGGAGRAGEISDLDASFQQGEKLVFFAQELLT